MWQLKEARLIKFHIIGSIATLICGLIIIIISFIPDYFISFYAFLLDERIVIVIPYLLFIAIGESFFSIWYFVFRK